jgi:Rhodanese-like domain
LHLALDAFRSAPFCSFFPADSKLAPGIYTPAQERKGDASMSDAPRITVNELKRRMDAGEDFTIIDVRNPQAWAQSDTMLPEAIRVPLDEFEQHLSQIPKNRPVVTYCT